MYVPNIPAPVIAAHTAFCLYWIWLRRLKNGFDAGASLLEALRRQHGKVLTCCALGYGRSAAVVLTWLLVYGGCRDLAQATAELKQARPQMVLPPETAKAVEAAAGRLKNF